MFIDFTGILDPIRRFVYGDPSLNLWNTYPDTKNQKFSKKKTDSAFSKTYSHQNTLIRILNSDNQIETRYKMITKSTKYVGFHEQITESRAFAFSFFSFYSLFFIICHFFQDLRCDSEYISLIIFSIKNMQGDRYNS